MEKLNSEDLDNVIMDCQVNLMIHDKARKKIFLLVTAKRNQKTEVQYDYSMEEPYWDNT